MSGLNQLVPALVLLLVGAPARATVWIPGDLGDLARQADAILLGRVADIRPIRSDDRGRIETLVTVEVLDYVKGNLGTIVAVRIPGGEIGRYRSVLVGAPSFQSGEEVVLFLYPGSSGGLHVLGLRQGVLRVVRDGSGERRVATPGTADRVADFETLPRFRERIRQLIAGVRQPEAPR